MTLAPSSPDWEAEVVEWALLQTMAELEAELEELRSGSLPREPWALEPVSELTGAVLCDCPWL